MLEFPGQVLELSMSVGRGTKGPLGHLVTASPPRPLIDFFLNLVRMFPSVSSCASTKKEFRSVDKHGRRRPSLIFLVIASPQKLLDGFE